SAASVEEHATTGRETLSVAPSASADGLLRSRRRGCVAIVTFPERGIVKTREGCWATRLLAGLHPAPTANLDSMKWSQMCASGAPARGFYRLRLRVSAGF